VPAQFIKLFAVSGEINLTAHQAMRPVRVNGIGVSQQGDFSGICGPAQVNQRPLRGRLKVKAPVRGKGTPLGSALPSSGCARAVGGDVAFRAFPQRLQGGVMETALYLSLPQPVELLDGGLEGRGAYPSYQVIKLLS